MVARQHVPLDDHPDSLQLACHTDVIAEDSILARNDVIKSVHQYSWSTRACSMQNGVAVSWLKDRPPG